MRLTLHQKLGLPIRAIEFEQKLTEIVEAVAAADIRDPNVYGIVVGILKVTDPQGVNSRSDLINSVAELANDYWAWRFLNRMPQLPQGGM